VRAVSPDELADRAAAGLHAHWQAQCGWIDGGEVLSNDGVLVTLTNLPDDTLNCAFVPSAPSDPRAALDWCVAEFARRRRTCGVEVRVGQRPEVEALLRERGFRVVVRRPAMTLHPLVAPPVEGRVHVRAVETDAELAAFQAIQSEVFDLTPEVAERFLPRAAVETPGVRFFLASYAGVDCGVAGVSLSEHGAGIVGVGTLAAYRHRGVGRAVTAAALGWAANRADLAWLYPSAMARRMYERLGFVTLPDEAQVWVS
jgi:GNAT superfamily N-acetyltransferase